MRRIIFFCALVFAVTLTSATTAGAQEVYGGTPPVDVEGDVATPDKPGNPGPEVRGDVVTRQVAGDSTGRGLPVTGGDVVGLTLLGLGAIGVGTAMVTIRRRSLQAA